jgi:hypothetical protein
MKTNAHETLETDRLHSWNPRFLLLHVYLGNGHAKPGKILFVYPRIALQFFAAERDPVPFAAK